MGIRLACLLAVAGVLLPGLGAAARAQEGDPVTLVTQYLRDSGVTGGHYRPALIGDDYVVDTFPEVAFVEVIFIRYPVAYAVPEPFGSSNLFLVSGGRVVHFLTDSDQLRLFFLFFLGTVETEGQARDAGRTWLRLTQVFSQDGYYGFSAPNVLVVPAGEGGVRAYVLGRVDVLRGGRGEISMLMLIDTAGRLLWVFEDRNVIEGNRPICQATKLLDPDPVVRQMAERSLLFMGRSAKPYLDEQRAKASPKLQEAIDRLWKQIEAQDR